MAWETGTVTPRGGQAVPARADVTRLTDSQRLARALPVGLGGTLLGLCTVVIPLMHFVSTWLVPLLSIGAAMYLYQRKATVAAVEGTCPKCSQALATAGGPWEEPMYVRCQACAAPLELKLDRPL